MPEAAFDDYKSIVLPEKFLEYKHMAPSSGYGLNESNGNLVLPSSIRWVTSVVKAKADGGDPPCTDDVARKACPLS